MMRSTITATNLIGKYFQRNPVIKSNLFTGGNFNAMKTQMNTFSTVKKPAGLQQILSRNLPFRLFENMNNLSKMPPAAQDTSATVYFENPPANHEEDQEAAAYLGVNKFYRSGGLTSFCVMKFEPLQDSDFGRYVESTKLDFYSKVPYGTVSEVQLAPELTDHLSSFGKVDTCALFFDKKRAPMDLQRPAELTFILKTPGGIWNVSCHSTFFTLSSHKDSIFGSMVQNLRVELKKQAGAQKKLFKTDLQRTLEQVATETAEAEQAKAIEAKSKEKAAAKKAAKTNAKLPRKRPSKFQLTQEASVGNINLQTNQPEDLGDIYYEVEE